MHDSRTFIYGVGIILILIFFAMAVGILDYTGDGTSKTDLGLQAVKYMYHFSSIEELDDNMEKLKDITTEQVYELLTIDNTDRALNVYLKFKNKPVRVNVEDFTDKYIIYSLDTESISKQRKFMFIYEAKKGKIQKVREVEIIDFVAN